MTQQEREESQPKKRPDQLLPGAMPQEQLVDFATKYANGDYDWSKIHTIVSTLHKVNGIRSFHNAISGPPTESSEQAVSILAHDLEGFTPDAELMRSDRFEEFWFKLDFGLHMSNDYGSVDEVEITAHEKRFAEVALNQFANLVEFVDTLQMEDLPALWKVQNYLARYLTEEHGINEAKSSIRHLTPAEEASAWDINYEVFANRAKMILLPALGSNQSRIARLNAACLRAEKRLCGNLMWNWRQINQAVEALGWVESRELAFTTTQYLLRELWHSANFQPDHMTPASSEDFDFSPEGLKKLLSFKLSQKELESMGLEYPQLMSEFYDHAVLDEASNPDAARFRVPYKLIPAELTIMLWRGAGRMHRQTFEKHLDYLKSVADTDKELTVNMVSVIAVLSFQGRLAPEKAEELVRGLKNLPDNFKEIILDQKPGRIFITPERKLRAVGPNGDIKNAFLLYQSTAPEVVEEAEVETAPVPSKEPVAKIDQGQKTADSVYPYDFVGDVAVLNDTDVNEYLNGLNTQVLFDTDESLAKIAGLKTSENLDGTYIWTAALNSGNPAMREARKLGFETIVISGNSITFVLSKDVLHSTQDGKKIPVGLTATLDEDGLVVFDANEDLTYEDIGIHASRVVLELVGSLQQKTGLELNAAKPVIDDWNKNKRGNMSRLSPNLKNEDVHVAVRIDGQTLFTSPA